MSASYHQRRDRWHHALSCPAMYIWSGVDRPARLVDFQGAHFDRAKQRLKLSRPCLGPGQGVPLGHCAEGRIATHRRVEADRRLVEYEHPRFVRQCPGDLEATAIPDAQHAYLVALAAGEAKPVETDARPLARPPAGDAVERGKIEQILAHAEVEIERLLLEHDADPTARASSATSTPRTVIRPDRATNNPVSSATSVDLPAPFGPINAVKCPGDADNDTPSRATVLP